MIRESNEERGQRSMHLLRIFRNHKSEVFRPDGGMVVVGCSEEGDIVVEEAGIPEIALQLEFCDGCCRAVAKYPGVRLNGGKLKSQRLKLGDRIEIGGTAIIVDTEPDTRLSFDVSADNFINTFGRFAAAVGKERDLRSLLRKAISILFEVIGGTDAFIFTLDENRRPRVFVSSASGPAEERFSDTVVQNVLHKGEGICIPNALSDPQLAGSQSIVDLRLSSVLCCPLQVAGKMNGIIYLGSRKATHSFSPRDLDGLSVYASVVAMLINHVEYISQQHASIRRLARSGRHEGIIGESKVMKDLLASVDSLAASDISVLLEGETGVGKDLFAQLIHRKSSRSGREFVVINCSSLQGQLMESELFGHRRGSFTGAVRDHAGLFRAAHGGTLFLDEIGEMDAGLQAKLLRTLETGMVRAVGATDEQSVDVRIICATNRDLSEMVERGEFRRDLYYRINQYCLRLPPLSRREDDCLLLAYFFLEKYKSMYPHKEIVDFHPDALEAIAVHDWPGNVRELAATVHKGVLASQGPLVTVDLGGLDKSLLTYDAAMRAFQQKLLWRAIHACGGSRDRAAQRLGLSRSTFFRYLAASGGTNRQL
ncbi:MAG: GAF domain-containing protein [Chitinivibrionales bacterium]|nr:GAF domain-containing protein [Chitinivibrionales bacterium]MBD3355737.1 GAF domain-containing protein [Chitinivibrionales bacterium]